MVEDFDVVVVGAGPAGSMTAYYAAEEGANVALLDRKPRIGVPVRCGEGLPARVMEDFEIGLDSSWVCNRPGRARFVSPRGRKIEFEPHLEACVLDRSVFDDMLAKRAVKKGARLFLERAVVGLDDNRMEVVSPSGRESYTGRVIVGADGVDSVVGRWAGMDTRLKPGEIGSCAQYRIKSRLVERDVMEFNFQKPHLPTGYGWVFPKGRGIANVGVGINPSRKTNAKAVLEKFLKNRFPDAKKLEFTVGCVPSSPPLEETARGRVLLVGDAARQVMAATGAGIANAFIAGRMAGQLAGAVGTGKKTLDHLLVYETRWRKRIGEKLDKSFRMKKRLVLDEKRFERFFKVARVAIGFYRVLPDTFKEKILADLHY
jgi:digeranylgeranylglycerophospholipid reductase